MCARNDCGTIASSLLRRLDLAPSTHSIVTECGAQTGIERMDSFFTRTEAAAWGGLISAYSRVSAQLEDDLRRNSGISRAEYEVLLRLFFSDEGRLRITAIADRSLLTRSGMSRLVDRLEDAGLVERHGDEDDRRGAYAAITEQGRDHFTATATRHTALVRELFLSHFSNEEQETMASFWDRLDQTNPGADTRT